MVSMSAFTEGNGRFVVGDLPPGPGVMVAVADGFAPYWNTVTLEAGKTNNARIRLLLDAAVTGTVVDSDGEPVAGAFVGVAYSASDGGGGLLEAYTTGRLTSSADGEFDVLGLLPDTPINIRAELDGRVSNTVTVNIPPGFVRENLVLRMQ